MGLLQITRFKQKNPVTVFRLLRRINLDNFAEFQYIAEREQKNGTSSLVLDLSEISALNSIGVRAIVDMHKMLTANGGDPLKLAAVQPPARDTLTATGITQFIDIFDTVDAAVQSFQ